MASVKLADKLPEVLKMAIFSFSATATTETFAMPVGTRVYGVAFVITSATARAATIAYAPATGVLTLGAIVSADTGFVTVIHE